MKKYRTIIIFIIPALILSAAAIFTLSHQKKDIDADHSVSNSISVQFPHDYMAAQKGQIKYETPAVYELLNIVLALSYMEEENSLLIDRQSSYYEEVVDHFKQYKDHPIVEKIKDANDQLGYSSLRHLFSYQFDGDSIVNNGIYNNESIAELLWPYIDGLQAFAAESGFQSFYAEHSNYYREQNQSLEDAVPIRQMWSWLEDKFPTKNDAYTLIVSPLTGNAYNTYQYKDDQLYSEIVVFTGIPSELGGKDHISDNLQKAFLSRLLFTQIDRNYINPTTNMDENAAQVMNAFSDQSKWISQSHRESPVTIFNEYMAWATFLLYAHDIYLGEDMQEIQSTTIDIMTGTGYTQFESFYHELLDLYLNRTAGSTMADLYPALIHWCASNG